MSHKARPSGRAQNLLLSSVFHCFWPTSFYRAASKLDINNIGNLAISTN